MEFIFFQTEIVSEIYFLSLMENLMNVIHFSVLEKWK